MLTACTPFSGLVYDEALDGPYRLTAIDGMEDLAIYWEIPGGGAVGDGLPGPGVIRAGVNDRYLVATARAPACAAGDDACLTRRANSGALDYWYVVRSADEEQRLPYNGIKGPLTGTEFAEAKTRLGLPEFTLP
ncbi:MAG: hypothetical protein ABL909_04150 [Sphingopyxis sp.]